MPKSSLFSKLIGALRVALDPGIHVQPLADLPDPDPVAVGRLTPGLRGLLACSQRARTQIADSFAHMEMPDPIGDRALLGSQWRKEQAGGTMARARTLLHDVVRAGGALSASEHAALEGCGFRRDRFEALPFDTAAEARAGHRRARAVAARLRRALTDLVALELAILDSGKLDPYR